MDVVDDERAVFAAFAVKGALITRAQGLLYMAVGTLFLWGAGSAHTYMWRWLTVGTLAVQIIKRTTLDDGSNANGL